MRDDKHLNSQGWSDPYNLYINPVHVYYNVNVLLYVCMHVIFFFFGRDGAEDQVQVYRHEGKLERLQGKPHKKCVQDGSHESSRQGPM